jgi:sulfatase modifying factor 1
LLLLLLLGLGIYAFLTSPLLYITTLITNTPSIFDDQMILIKGGTFMMGSPDTEADRENDEYQHRVTVSSFKMSKYEVTQSQWHTITGENPSFFDGCKFCPVEQISYDDIQKFLLKLNTKSAKKYRLPTEAEWEYAARGGNQSRNFKFAGSNNLSEVGWYYENSGEKRLNEKDWSANNAQSNNCRTHPVGDKAPNELGLYDMSGNVWEWCSDWYDSNYYENSPVDNPKGPAIGLKRVLRGGSWNYDALNCRTTFRDYNTPDSRHNNFGFRLVSDP